MATKRTQYKVFLFICISIPPACYDGRFRKCWLALRGHFSYLRLRLCLLRIAFSTYDHIIIISYAFKVYIKRACAHCVSLEQSKHCERIPGSVFGV